MGFSKRELKEFDRYCEGILKDISPKLDKILKDSRELAKKEKKLKNKLCFTNPFSQTYLSKLLFLIKILNIYL